MQAEPDVCLAYAVGNPVLLLWPKRRQKLLPPFEAGWVVKAVVSPSTVVLRHHDGYRADKVVNIDIVKSDPQGFAKGQSTGDEQIVEHSFVPELEEVDEPTSGLELQFDSDSEGPVNLPPARCLRDRSLLNRPARYTD